MMQKLIAAICVAGALAFAGLVWADVDFDSLGRPMPVPSAAMAKVLAYSGSNVTTITATAPDGSTYVKTLTYSGSNVTNVSGWVKQ